MKIILPSFTILRMNTPEDIVSILELAAKTCYKSAVYKDQADAEDFITSRIIATGHHSVIEHAACTILFICDRGVTHELVRHRLASFSQESTRYCNYSKGNFDKEITVIKPLFFEENSPQYNVWKKSCEISERAYMTLLGIGCSPQEARSVLPNSLKTEIVVTANMREWRHILKLRTSKKAHPQMREIMIPLLDKMTALLPFLFMDIYEEKYEG